MSLPQELTDRERKFLKAAFKVAPNKGDSFSVKSVGTSLGDTHEQSRDIAKVLGRDRGLTRSFADDQNYLTETARLYVLKLGDDAKAARRKQVWAALKFVWVSAVSLGMAYLLHRTKDLAERADKPAPAPATQTTRP